MSQPSALSYTEDTATSQERGPLAMLASLSTHGRSRRRLRNSTLSAPPQPLAPLPAHRCSYCLLRKRKSLQFATHYEVYFIADGLLRI